MLRPLAASFAVFAVLSVGVSDADVAQPPKPAAVKAWFGEWTTNGHGTLEIYDARYIPRLQGAKTCPCVWQLVAAWERPRGAPVLVGGVLGRDNRVLSASYPLRDGTERTGSIRASRTGDRFSGFWKPCRTYCTTTKWSARRHASERYRVGWRFTQSGLPKGQTVIPTRSGGAGSVIFRRRVDLLGFPSAGSKVFHIDLIPQFADLRLEFRAGDRIQYQRRARENKDLLFLTLEVSNSNDPNCPFGEEASLHLVDGNGGAPDEASLDFFNNRACRHSESWVSNNTNRLSVVISARDRE